MIDAAQLNPLDAQQLREIARSPMSEIVTKEAAITRHNAEIGRRDCEIAFELAHPRVEHVVQSYGY